MTTDVTQREAARVTGDAREEGSDSFSDAPGARVAATDATSKVGFFRRYRLPLTLGFIALCLYAGSIVYILYGRGQIA